MENIKPLNTITEDDIRIGKENAQELFRKVAGETPENSLDFALKIINRQSKLIDSQSKMISRQNVLLLFQNNKQLDQVLEWSKSVSSPIGENIQMLDDTRLSFIFKLIDEELDETKKAVNILREYLHLISNESELIVDREYIIRLWREVVDGFADTKWVISRAEMELGIHTIAEDVFTAVYNANMSKLCDTEDQAQETVDYYMETENLPTYYEKVYGDKFVIKRTSDNKILKNKYWVKPDVAIEEILNKLI